MRLIRFLLVIMKTIIFLKLINIPRSHSTVNVDGRKKKKTSIRKFEEKKLDIEASRLLLEDRRYQDAKLMEEKRFALEEKRFGLEGKRVEGETIRFELEKIRTYSAILETAIAGAALLLGIAVVGSSGCTVFIY